jgi:hypothetical protein
MDANTVSAIVVACVTVGVIAHRFLSHVEIMGGRRTPSEWKRKETPSGEDA